MQALRAVMVIAMLLGTAGRVASQNTDITGVVTDPSGAVLSGAELLLRAASGQTWETSSDLSGRFLFVAPGGGPFTLTVMYTRFTPITLDVVAAQPSLRVVLQPVGVREEVTVVAPLLTASRTSTATRTDTPLLDVPQAVSVVTRGLVADQAMASMADVVRYVPGVGMAQGEGHRDAPIFRGNTSTADFFVDGVRDDTQYFRDLYNVDRVEALKGPSGMVFGRGGVGGVINRVTRQANWMPTREFAVQGGTWDNRRLTTDLGHAFSSRAAGRITGVYENSNSYRAGVNTERYGVNPTVALALGNATTVRLGYEFFRDARTTDRGVPSFRGLPLPTQRSTFFGSADESDADVTVNMLTGALDHRFGNGLSVRSRTSFADYDKFYQNVFAGAVNAAGTTVNLNAYNSGTDRRNVFNQTDFTLKTRLGHLEHTLLAGTEVGRQVTNNLRLTGYFPTLGASVTTATAPLTNPVTTLPLTFRAAVTDADNHGVANTAALYVQDQVTLTRFVQALVGVRYDNFRVTLRNNPTSQTFQSTDNLVSPRVGLIVKPRQPVSVYASYSLAYQPRAGEQLASLTASNEALDPEAFRNVEVGAKWDIRPGLSFSTAVYRLTRGNVVVPDPLDATRSLLVDGQQSRGLELELGGQVLPTWSLVTGYAFQDATITRSQSATAQAGARLGQVPRHSFSIWNRIDATSRLGLGVGLITQGARFVATDNLVTLPAFARVDAAVFYRVGARVRLQANIENVFDETYYPSAHNNNNITPGSPRALRLGLTTEF